MKVVFNFGLGTNQARGEYEREHDIISGLVPHPNLVRFWSQTLDPIPEAIASILPDAAQASYVHNGEVRRRKTQFVILDYHPFSLDQVLQAMPRPLPVERVLRWAADLIRGLLHLRAGGVSHLDLKLDNALIAKDGRLVLCDFGTANRLDLPLLEAEFTHGMPTGGNPAHSAPEVWNAVSRLHKHKGLE